MNFERLERAIVESLRRGTATPLLATTERVSLAVPSESSEAADSTEHRFDPDEDPGLENWW